MEEKADVSDCRVLAIQSHVVSGFVGNKCAVFPMQLHGFEVDSINSVQFSNHTGYKHWKGQVLNSSQLWELYEGLQLNNLHQDYSHVLTGYVSERTFLATIRDILIDVQKHHPNLFYICDPVLGDNGNYYVPEELTEIYRTKIIPLATLVTPNQFELSVLSEMKVESETEALAAIKHIHAFGPEYVVVTSSSLGPPDRIHGYGSSKDGVFRFDIEKLPYWFLGTGDLFTGLLLVWMQKTNRNLKRSVESTLGSIQDILKRTLKCALEKSENPSVAQLELKLIQSQKEVMEPKSQVKIVTL